MFNFDLPTDKKDYIHRVGRTARAGLIGTTLSFVKPNERMLIPSIACHLLKAVQFWTDYGLGSYGLYYLRDKEKREVDFLITKDEKPWFLIEVKYKKNHFTSPSLKYFQKKTNCEHAFQVVVDLPYVDKNCFNEKEPIIVPAKKNLSQLV